MSSLPAGMGCPLQSGSAPCRAALPVPLLKSATQRLNYLSPLLRGGRGSQHSPFQGSEGHVRGHCSSSESPRQSEGSNRVTFQGIRQTVGIKSFTWKLALSLQALLLSPAQLSIFVPFTFRVVVRHVCECLVPGGAASTRQIQGALSKYWTA